MGVRKVELMANEEHLNILRHGVPDWNTWRDKNPHVPKDLSDADLSGLNLSGASLFNANLSGAKLINTKLVGTRLENCDLTDADLSNADLTRANLSQSNLRGATLDHAVLSGANLVRGDASNASFRGANLEKANLESRRLCGADLEEANLHSAILKGANLSAASMKRSNLSAAQLRGAELSDACLAGANLENADLEDAKGIVPAQLAGTNLYHVKIDKESASFDELARIAEIAKYSRRVFSFLFLLCIFSWLTISQATDEALLTNSKVAALPIIQVSVPMASLFFFMPVFLFVLFIYFHMNLQGLWTGLASLPAVFPDGQILTHRAFPWIMTCIVYLFVHRLKNRRPSYWLLNVLIAIIGTWLVAPTTVVCFFLRYAQIGDWLGAGWLVLWGCLVVWFTIDSYIRTSKTFAEAGTMPFASTAQEEGA